MDVPVFVIDLTIDKKTKVPLLVLQERSGHRQLPICIGLMEASAIAAAKEGLELPRPMTHDLLASLMKKLGGHLESVHISDMHESTFYALLRIKCSSRMVEIDCRPSDAVALALRTKSPIFVAPVVLDRAGITAENKDKWTEFLENLEPEAFGKYKM